MTAPIDRRTLGRQLTKLGNASVAEVLRFAAAPPREDVFRIGLTGAPGVGKSCLAAKLSVHRASRRRIGILAVDPSSPISQGAILGDRIRLDEMNPQHDIYMRSVASRSSNDGLAENIPELLEAMAVAGFDELLVETVGVGQAEHGVRSQVDTLVLVLMPDSGDTVQAMKAGIMELADIYVVNKCDLPGAETLAAEIGRVQALVDKPESWVPPVILTCRDQDETIELLSSSIDKHRRWLQTTNVLSTVRMNRARYRLELQLKRRINEVVDMFGEEFYAHDLAWQYSQAAKKIALEAKTKTTHE